MPLKNVARMGIRHAPKVIAPKAYAGYFAVSRGLRLVRRVIGPKQVQG